MPNAAPNPELDLGDTCEHERLTDEIESIEADLQSPEVIADPALLFKLRTDRLSLRRRLHRLSRDQA